MRRAFFSKVYKIKISNKTIVISLVSLLVLGSLFTAIVSASIPDSNGVIHACYSNRDGTLRVIDTAAGGICNTSKETALNWAQVNQSALNNANVVSSRVTFPWGNSADGQTILDIPGFGTIKAVNCYSDGNQIFDNFDYHNSSAYTQQLDMAPAVENILIPSNANMDDNVQAPFASLQRGQNIQIGYTDSNSIQRIVVVSLSDFTDFNNPYCSFQAQAVISQN